MTEQSNSIQAETAGHARKQRARFAAAALTVGLAMATAGCADQALDSSIQTVNEDPATDKKVSDRNKKPEFRANSVAILDSGRVQASGALIKDTEGKYQILSVEHVTRGMYGMQPEENTPPGISSGKAKSIQAYVPGVGVLAVDDDKPDFSGSTKPRRFDRLHDRASSMELGTQNQEILARAEQGGKIAVSALAPLDGKLGDRLYMPLSDTGKKVPFVFITNVGNERNPQSAAELAPLYLLDRDLDYDKGMAALEQAARKHVADHTGGNWQTPTYEQAIKSVLVDEFQTSLFDQVDSGEIKATDAAEYLGCHADSGAPFLDGNDNIVGVLSAGYYFYRSGTVPNTADMRLISRDGPKYPLRSCFSNAVITAALQ